MSVSADGEGGLRAELNTEGWVHVDGVDSFGIL
jgi:hypothetical protein